MYLWYVRWGRGIVTKKKKQKNKKKPLNHKLPSGKAIEDGANGKEPTCQCRRRKRSWFSPWVRKMPWRRAWQPTPVVLPGESHGQRRLTGYGS